MLNGDNRLSANEQQVAAKVMDGEAILINLSNGLYYSMGGAGGLIWKLIEKRRSLNEIANLLTDQFNVSRDQVIADIQQLASELLAEDLVLVSEESTSLDNESPDLSDLPASYESPKLKKYDDMADMFALDPPLPGLAEVPGKDVPRESKD